MNTTPNLGSLLPFVLSVCLGGFFSTAFSAEPANVGDRRELFVDDALIESITGDAALRLHHPTPREIVLDHDAPWEGTGCGYHSVFQDGDRYRMYYKAWNLEVSPGKLNTGRHPLYCCYAESKGGIHWTKPKLGLHEFKGSKDNNIVITSGAYGDLKADAGHPAVFKDDNPKAPAGARYKAILRSSGARGLLVFQSPDGLHWKPLSRKPIFNGLGAFDSQNLAFWDPTLGKYRAYWRAFSEGSITEKEWKPGGYRIIRTATSDDLAEWGPFSDLVYDDSPAEHLYTNQVKGGELVTKPLVLKGKRLSLNFATSAAGSVRVEIQSPDGSPLPGFSLKDCPPQFGDSIGRPVSWKNGPDLSAVSGKPIRLRFVLRDADLYAYQAER